MSGPYSDTGTTMYMDGFTWTSNAFVTPGGSKTDGDRWGNTRVFFAPVTCGVQSSFPRMMQGPDRSIWSWCLIEGVVAFHRGCGNRDIDLSPLQTCLSFLVHGDPDWLLQGNLQAHFQDVGTMIPPSTDPLCPDRSPSIGFYPRATAWSSPSVQVPPASVRPRSGPSGVDFWTPARPSHIGSSRCVQGLALNLGTSLSVFTLPRPTWILDTRWKLFLGCVGVVLIAASVQPFASSEGDGSYVQIDLHPPSPLPGDTVPSAPFLPVAVQLLHEPMAHVAATFPSCLTASPTLETNMIFLHFFRCDQRSSCRSDPTRSDQVWYVLSRHSYSSLSPEFGFHGCPLGLGPVGRS